MGEFAARLVTAPPDDPDFDRYPTAATTVIDFEDGTRLDWGTGRLRAFVVPKDLE